MQFMYRLRTMFVGLAMATPLAACLSNPATGVAANGDALRVQYLSGTGTYVSNDKTGEDVTTYSDGSQHVTEHFQPVAHSFRWNDWKYFQGRQELDEQDYYRIADDAAAAQRIADIRASASLKMKIGAPLLVVGLVSSLVITSLGSGASDRSLVTLGTTASSLVGLGGGLVWYWGRNDMANHHHLPSASADERADVIEECNEGRCTRARGGRRAAAATGDSRTR